MIDTSATSLPHGNSVSISGGTVSQNVIGGRSLAGKAIGNTVSIKNAASFGITGVSSFYGGSVSKGDGDVFTGNTLNLIEWQQAASKLSNIGNFENYNFVLPANVLRGAAILTVMGTVDLTNGKKGVDALSSRIDVSINGDSVRQIGEKFTLISAGNLITAPGPKLKATGVQGYAQHYEFDIAQVGHELVAAINAVQRSP